MADAKLREIFLNFCDTVKKGSTVATDKTLKKICMDCKLCCEGMDMNRVDIQFRKHLGNSKKNVDFAGFCSFIEGALAEAYIQATKQDREAAVSELKNKIIAAGGPKTHGVTSISHDSATSRLTDVQGYTGSHKERFDMETGKGKGMEGKD
ncbi:unnamed protein product [Protopolystoma xenopodis]|uniref:Tubulin polymerization-promoting protein family member 3 n=1 Tax=Protopolystoma xenopodis TaxID=117903 RepID=A0A448WDC3_9PLAT|nr:unnamed protein product [Protopolystoma xenopodis]